MIEEDDQLTFVFRKTKYYKFMKYGLLSNAFCIGTITPGETKKEGGDVTVEEERSSSQC